MLRLRQQMQNQIVRSRNLQLREHIYWRRNFLVKVVEEERLQRVACFYH
jgi:hypothetical protein